MKRTITMRTLAAGPDYIYLADKTYDDVPSALAKSLVDGGYAAYANGEPAAKKAAEVEKAPEAPAPPPPTDEAPPAPPVKKRRRRKGKKK